MEKLKKKYLFLFVIVIIGIIIGFLFANILSKEDEKLVFTKITTFFNNLKDDVPINYMSNLTTSLKNNLLIVLAIWVLGLSIIGLILNNFILFFKSFILGFSVGSIINIYLYGGIVLSLVYIFPSLLINLFIYIIMIYHANNFSLCLFKVLFRKKEYKFQPLIKKYVKLLGICVIVLIISSLLETFLTPFLIKLFSFLIK